MGKCANRFDTPSNLVLMSGMVAAQTHVDGSFSQPLDESYASGYPEIAIDNFTAIRRKRVAL